MQKYHKKYLLVRIFLLRYVTLYCIIKKYMCYMNFYITVGGLDMRNFLKQKGYLLGMQVLTLVQLVLACIPLFNPLGVDAAGKYSLFSMILHVGSVSEFYAGYSDALFLNTFLFVVSLLFTLLLLFLLMTLVFSFAGGESSRSAAKTTFYIAGLGALLYAILFFVLTDLHTQILEAGQGYITRKLFIYTKVPFGLYLFFFISLLLMAFSFKVYGFRFRAVWYNMLSKAVTYFKGGVHPHYHKWSAEKPIEALAAPDEMIYPMSQHIGAVCSPTVKVGDDVTIGQTIGDSEAPVSAPIHATVSGKVTKVGPYLHPNGKEIMSVFVQNDHEDRLHEDLLQPERDYLSLGTEEIIGIIRKAGIVGMGGAAFPTHIKIASAKGKVDTIIINAAECEPYLTSDHRVMLENTAELIEGIKILRYTLQVKQVFIGIESNKPDAISLLSRKLRRSGIRVVVLQTKYPQGGEKQLIKAITRREVPSGKLPADVGCCVFNVDTAIAVYRAVVKHRPLMRRIVTLGGKALKNPKNVSVRIGTPVSFVLQQNGLQEDKLKKLIMGGPMMGNALYSLEVPVIKGTSGLLCFSDHELGHYEAPETHCIHCGRCVSVCPMNLMPNYIGMYTAKDDFDAASKFGAMDCIECGCCSYTCPAKIPLIQYIRLAKQTLAARPKDTK